MKKFERFIIYPMLFIALFFSFAGDEVKKTTAQDFFNEIITKKITVMNRDTEEVITLEGTNEGGRITLKNENGENIVITSDNDGASMIAIKKPNQDGGIILSSTDTETGIRMYGPLNEFYKGKNNINFGNASLSLISNNESNVINVSGETQNSGLLVGNNENDGGVGVMNMKDYGGVIMTYDSYGDQMVEIGKNGNNDGAIFIYDKYNEKYGAYYYGGYGGDFKNKSK